MFYLAAGCCCLLFLHAVFYDTILNTEWWISSGKKKMKKKERTSCPCYVGYVYLVWNFFLAMKFLFELLACISIPGSMPQQWCTSVFFFSEADVTPKQIYDASLTIKPPGSLAPFEFWDCSKLELLELGGSMFIGDWPWRSRLLTLWEWQNKLSYMPDR